MAASDRPRRTVPLQARPRRTTPLTAEPVIRPPRIEPLRAAPEPPGFINGRPIRTEPLVARPLRTEPLTALRPTRLEPLRAAGSAVDDLAAAATGAVRTGGNNLPVHIPGMGTGATAAEILGSQGAKAAAGAAGLGGLLAKGKGLLSTESQVLPKLSGLKRAGLGLGVSYGADFLADQVDPEGGLLNRTLSGAGQGAGLGLLSKNPMVVLGGTLGGAALGALGILGGGKGGDKGLDVDKTRTFMSGAGFESDEIEQYLAFYELEKDAAGEEVANTNLLTRLSGAMDQMELARVSEAEERQAQARMLASQALAGKFFQPFAKDMIEGANVRAGITKSLLPSLPAEYRGVAQLNAANHIDNASSMARAYQAQAQMIPAMSMMQQQQDNVNSIAAQLLQQGYQGAITGQGGATNIAELLSQGQ